MNQLWIARVCLLIAASGILGCDDRTLVPLNDGGMDASQRDANDDDASDNDAGGDSGMDASLSPAVRLQGLWEGACISDPDADGGGAESTRQGFAFRGNQFVSRVERYFDPTCETAIVRVEFSGTFGVGEAIANLDDTYELDVTIGGLTAQILDADFEDLANAEAFLGFTDWNADTPRDVLGIDVFGTSNPIAQGSVVYQIFRVELVSAGSVDVPVLYLGEESGDGPTLMEANRPATLSAAPHVFTGPAN